jgi:anti-sigma factor RsiW
MNDSDCKQIFELLSQYLDGELPPAASEEFRRHIQDCAPCVDFVESLKKSMKLSREYQPGEQPPELPAAVKKSLSEAYARAIGSRRRE